MIYSPKINRRQNQTDALKLMITKNINLINQGYILNRIVADVVTINILYRYYNQQHATWRCQPKLITQGLSLVFLFIVALGQFIPAVVYHAIQRARQRSLVKDRSAVMPLVHDMLYPE
ncbi:hypothetical protein PT286_00500 [Neisseriaceae bacterium ESL0693]|nr:hypothetical protein [Neisseriaceae bacterium ESL0693]